MSFKRHAFVVGLLLIFIACQSQPLNPVMTETRIAPSAITPGIVEPTFTPEVIPSFLEEEPGPFQFEGIKMFDEDGTGEIEKTSGWAVALLPDYSESIVHTNDGGRTWEHSTPTMGIQYTYSPPIFFSSQIAWNTNLDNMLEQSRNGGQTWTSITDFSSNPYFPQGGELYFWSADQGMSISGTPAAGTAFLTLSKTSDGGMNWEKLNLTPPWEGALSDFGELLFCNLCSYKFYIDASRIIIEYGLTADQSLESTMNLTFSFDEGKTWRTSEIVIPENLIHHRARFGEMTFFDNQQGVFSLWSTNKKSFGFYEEYSMLFSFYTEDGGLNWTMRTPTPTADIDQQFVGFERYFSPMEAVVRCGEVLCTTHDGAQTWTLIQPDIEFPSSSNATEWLEVLDFIDPNLGFVIFSTYFDTTKLYQTSDGGIHWKRLEYQFAE